MWLRIEDLKTFNRDAVWSGSISDLPDEIRAFVDEKISSGAWTEREEYCRRPDGEIRVDMWRLRDALGLGPHPMIVELARLLGRILAQKHHEIAMSVPAVVQEEQILRAVDFFRAKDWTVTRRGKTWQVSPPGDPVTKASGRDLVVWHAIETSP
jgi:hypothetical protein